MTTQDKVQLVSDELHAVTDHTDRLLARISRLTALTAEARIETGMTGIQSQRTLNHLATAAMKFAEVRKSLVLAHSSAECDAPKADFPWECPPEQAQLDNIHKLKA